MPWIYINFIADMEIKYIVYIPAVNLDLTQTLDYYLGSQADGLTWKLILNKNDVKVSDCNFAVIFTNGDTTYGGAEEFQHYNSDSLGVEAQCTVGSNTGFGSQVITRKNTDIGSKMALSSIGILITCDCTNTFAASNTMDSIYYYADDLLASTSSSVAIGGLA
jgi:hypothetical protein